MRVDRFLGQATQFSVTRNVSEYHFMKRAMEVYHRVECVFMGKCVQNPVSGAGTELHAPGPWCQGQRGPFCSCIHPHWWEGVGSPSPNHCCWFLGFERGTPGYQKAGQDGIVLLRLLRVVWGPNHHHARTLFLHSSAF